MRVFDRDLIRGGHYGQRSCEPHPKGRTHGCTDQCCKREESSCQLGAVHTWHLAATDVRDGMSAAGESGRRIPWDTRMPTGASLAADRASRGANSNTNWRT